MLGLCEEAGEGGRGSEDEGRGEGGDHCGKEGRRRKEGEDSQAAWHKEDPNKEIFFSSKHSFSLEKFGSPSVFSVGAFFITAKTFLA